MKIADYKKGAVESLAKLPHGVAALTSLLFGQVACWDLKLRLALVQVHALTAACSHQHM